jgi:putative hydrolase of the HAD superfamily
MTITTVLLDAGGVLLDESEMEASRARATARTLRSIVPGYDVEAYGRDIEEAVRCFCPDAYRHVFWRHLRPDAVACDTLYSTFLTAWRPTRPPLLLMDGIAREMRRMVDRFRVGLAGQCGAEVLGLLERHDLLECLAWRFTQDDFDITKPDPRFYERITAACGVSPGECVLVGDRIDKDVVPAKMLGMRTVRIRTGVHRNQEPRIPAEVPDVELDSVVGLAEAIDAL